VSHFRSKEVQDVAQKSNFFYAEGFFLTVSPETISAAATYANSNDKVQYCRRHLKVIALRTELISYFYN
jgi:hypothetical protein